MIEKFIKIFRVGKLEDYSAAGDMKLRKINLIFGANGSGKTTLCAVLRSLQTGDGTRITERATLNRTGNPEVHLLLEGAKAAKFKQSKWDCGPAKLEIYDTNFVYENVYVGNDVSHDHKRAIYGVIVGDKGVALSRKVDQLAEEIKVAHGAMTDAHAQVQAKIWGSDTVEKFVELKESATIDDLIAEQEKTIAAYRSAAEIAAKGTLSQIDVPVMPSLELLAKTIEDVSEAAEKMVAEHTRRLGDDGERWIEKGFGYLHESAVCPFCTQPVDGIDLVGAYRSHFSESYSDLKNQVKKLAGIIDSTFGPNALIALQKRIASNELLSDFWTRFATLGLPPLLFADIETACKSLHENLRKHVDLKEGKPLELVPIDAILGDAIVEFEKLQARAAAYNAALTGANKLIAAKKAETQAGNVAAEQAKLDTLKNTKLRHTPAFDALCADFKTKAAAKETLEQQKQKAKDDLDLYSNNIFPLYQQELNKLLQHFGAEFKITEPTRSFTGGKASSSYEIVINSQNVSLAARKAGDHCLGNTLSGGDRAALALAFFIVKLAHDPNIADKCIVFDDPVCSLDDFRTECTVEQILKVAKKAKQIIILCHDPYFLKRVYDRTNAADARTFFLDRTASGTNLAPWDIDEATRSQYFQDYFTLATFLAAGPGGKDLRDLVRKIRPLLEENLRFRFPDHFSTGWLGDFIGAVSKAQPGEPLAALQPFLAEMQSINDCSKEYHHGTGTNPDTHPINEPELKAYVGRTFAFLRGAA